ncbi:hypothetical protein [Exiguobacterium flavidum]|uniref:hypothetical protein n=1 Tax=Exiguobacterium flavidum TaxID=2184695 RepID=UPI0013004A78|nr:hypothetical protein [Exiguobacterium flavidum]
MNRKGLGTVAALAAASIAAVYEWRKTKAFSRTHKEKAEQILIKEIAEGETDGRTATKD